MHLEPIATLPGPSVPKAGLRSLAHQLHDALALQSGLGDDFSHSHRAKARRCSDLVHGAEPLASLQTAIGCETKKMAMTGLLSWRTGSIPLRPPSVGQYSLQLQSSSGDGAVLGCFLRLSLIQVFRQQPIRV